MALRETDLYLPVKRFLEAQGYTVKGEIGPADIVARSGDDPPVIVELKTRFALALFHQAVERQRLTDAVYIAVLMRTGAAFRQSLKQNLGLCRRLGLGLMTVRMSDEKIEVHADPAPYRPRPATRRRTAMLREFDRRKGDPSPGGAPAGKRVTAYRQDALRCAVHIHKNGPTKAAKVAEATSVPRARRIMADNHYGWFRRVDTGIYTLTEAGMAAAQGQV